MSSIRMPDNECLALLEQFTTVQLQTVLSFGSVSKTGRKARLFARAVSLLNDVNKRFAVECKIKEIYLHSVNTNKTARKRRQSKKRSIINGGHDDDGNNNNNNNNKRNRTDPHPVAVNFHNTGGQQQQDNEVQALDLSCSSGSSSKNSSLTNLLNVQRRDFKKLAFYECLDVLLKPTSLTVTSDCQNGGAINWLPFTLSTSQISDISNGTVQDEDDNISYNVQVHVRVGRTDIFNELGEIMDELPLGFKLTVNNDVSSIPMQYYNNSNNNNNSSNNNNNNNNRPLENDGSNNYVDFPPIDVTEILAVDPFYPNFLRINWIPDGTKTFAVTMHLVRKLNVIELTNELKRNAVQSKEITRRIIRQNSVRDTEDVQTVLLKVSLICPLTGRRLDIPARGKNCEHLQCFDLKNYLELIQTRPVWRCPICRKSCRFEELTVDEYFLDVLSSSSLNERANSITFDDNGDWVESDLNRKERNYSVIDDDDDYNNLNKTIKPKIECVDLSSSDYDDNDNSDNDNSDNDDNDEYNDNDGIDSSGSSPFSRSSCNSISVPENDDNDSYTNSSVDDNYTNSSVDDSYTNSRVDATSFPRVTIRLSSKDKIKKKSSKYLRRNVRHSAAGSRKNKRRRRVSSFTSTSSNESLLPNNSPAMITPQKPPILFGHDVEGHSMATVSRIPTITTGQTSDDYRPLSSADMNEDDRSILYSILRVPEPPNNDYYFDNIFNAVRLFARDDYSSSMANPSEAAVVATPPIYDVYDSSSDE